MKPAPLMLAAYLALLATGTGRGQAADSAPAPTPPMHHHGTSAMEIPAPEAHIPGDSLYQLPLSLTTAEGTTITLASLRGAPLVVTMFYSHCTSVCPLLTSQLQRLIGELAPAERGRLRVLMLSFDSVRDTPEALAAFKLEHRIGDANWIVARASASDVRLLAAALGIRYRELADHTFNHSALISVTDRQGVVKARTSRLTGPDPQFVAALRAEAVRAAR